MRVKRQNQQYPPKSDGKDSKGNKRVRCAVKTGKSTTIIAEGCTDSCFKCAWTRFVEDIKAGGGRVPVDTTTCV